MSLSDRLFLDTKSYGFNVLLSISLSTQKTLISVLLVELLCYLIYKINSLAEKSILLRTIFST